MLLKLKVQNLLKKTLEKEKQKINKKSNIFKNDEKYKLDSNIKTKNKINNKNIICHKQIFSCFDDISKFFKKSNKIFKRQKIIILSKLNNNKMKSKGNYNNSLDIKAITTLGNINSKKIIKKILKAI